MSATSLLAPLRRGIRLGGACALASLCCLVLPAKAQNYPSKPITIVVPFAAGGASDITARLIGQELSSNLHTPVVVDNKPGANSQIGTAFVVRSAADGYTLLMGTTSLINNVHFYPQMPYDASRSLAPVVGVVDVPAFLLVGGKVKEKTAKDFVAMAAKSGTSLNYASAGAGSTLHLAAEWFKSVVGFQAQHVPLKGSGPAVTSVAAGETDFSFENLGPAQPQIDAGRVRVLAIAAPKRFPTLPNVPTLKEAGLPDVDLSSWFVLMTPTGTPPAVVQTLNQEVNKALAKPEIRNRLLKLGLVPLGGTTEQLATRMQQDSGKWGSIIRSANIKLD
ncbi:MAG TPA: tripartite tricarboxylate transporter substrate binding protein [Variovorax sp.]|nr:tripartite tricarboxylate transporter substrate binding protein [Variovorax sp.]